MRAVAIERLLPTQVEHGWQGIGSMPHMLHSLVLHFPTSSPFFTSWGGHQKKPIAVDDLNIPTIVSYLVCGYIICNLTYNHILCLAPLILHLSLGLECIQLHEDYVTWHELHCTCHSVIVLFLQVFFTVGLQVCFSISLFEALPHFFNISWDVARAHMDAHCWKVEINWKMWASPKHQMKKAMPSIVLVYRNGSHMKWSQPWV